MNASVDKYLTRTTGKVRWRVRWDLPPGPDGERRRGSKGGFRTRAEATVYLRDTLGANGRGVEHVRSTVTVAQYLRGWLQGKRIRATTRDNYRTSLMVHVLPRLGGMRLVDVDHRTLNALYRELEAHGKAAGPCRTAGITCRTNKCTPHKHKGLSTKSVQHVHGALRTALQDAVRDALIGRNPADLAEPPRRNGKQRRVTSDQIWRVDVARGFLDQIRDERLEALWTLALLTGMRRAELAGLTWEHVDLDAGTLDIRMTTTTVRGQQVTTDGKTDASWRRLYLDEQLVALLRQHRTRQALWLTQGRAATATHVFTELDGRPIHPQTLTTRFRRLTQRLDLPRIGLHGLRHTAATIMLNHGVPVHIVANRLGHSDAATTLSIYIHVTPNDDRVAADAMARVFFRDASGSDGRDEASDPTPSERVPHRLGHRWVIAEPPEALGGQQEQEAVEAFPQIRNPMMPGGRGGT